MTACTLLWIGLWLPHPLHHAVAGDQPAASRTNENETDSQVYRGVSHVHSEFSHDSNASLALIIQEAQDADYDFVIVTDHNSRKGKTIYDRMKPPPRPLLIFGNEISAPDGHLIALGVEDDPPADVSSQELIDWIHARGGYAILPHPFSGRNPWKNWEVEGWDGLELFNFGHRLYEENTVDLYLRSLDEAAETWLKEVQEIPREHFSLWDELAAHRPIAAVAGTDAHLKRGGSKTFPAAMQSVILYVSAAELNEPQIVKAIGSGNLYIAFETLGSAAGFSFSFEIGAQTFGPGDSVEDTGAGSGSFHIHVPLRATIRLIRNGSVLSEKESTDLVWPASGPGMYRAEVYRDGQLWIFTNPIYVR